MSIKVMSWVWENSTVQGGELLVLLAMADHANDAGERIFPSVDSLRQKARLSRRQVQRILRGLEESGQIRQLGHHIPKGRPDRATIEYAIDMTKCRPAENGMTSKAERGDAGDANGAVPMSPDPSLEPSKNCQSSEFDDFWNTYPRREGKVDAQKAWKMLRPDNELLQRIIVNLSRYSETEKRFIPLPATYLRGRRWEDGPTVAVARAVPIRARVNEVPAEPPPTPEQAAANKAILHNMIERIGAK